MMRGIWAAAAASGGALGRRRAAAKERCHVQRGRRGGAGEGSDPCSEAKTYCRRYGRTSNTVNTQPCCYYCLEFEMLYSVSLIQL